MSQQQREALDQLLRDGPLDIGGDLDFQRPLFESMASAQPLPGDVAVSQRVLAGIPVIDIGTYRGLIEEGQPAERIAVAGESARAARPRTGKQNLFLSRQCQLLLDHRPGRLARRRRPRYEDTTIPV